MSVAAIEASMREVDLSVIACPTAMQSVYVLVNGDRIIYVGRTVTLLQRIATHRSGTTNDLPKIFDRAFAIEMPAVDAHACEGALIRRFNPLLCAGAPTDNGRDLEMLQRFGLEFDAIASDSFRARRSQLFIEAHRHSRIREITRRGWRRTNTSRVIWKATLRYLKRELEAS